MLGHFFFNGFVQELLFGLVQRQIVHKDNSVSSNNTQPVNSTQPHGAARAPSKTCCTHWLKKWSPATTTVAVTRIRMSRYDASEARAPKMKKCVSKLPPVKWMNNAGVSIWPMAMACRVPPHPG
jgi:hypothetical protein